MEFALLLSLVGFLGGLWVYLYGVILDITVKAPADATLIVLGLAHWTVLCYFSMALYVFYETGLSLRTNHEITGTARKAERMLLETWPITLIALVIGFACARVGSSNFAVKAPIVIFAISGLAIIPYRLLRKRPISSADSLPTETKIRFLFGLAILFIPYIFVMSNILAGVRITTDKEFYSASDTVLVTIEGSGYIIRPVVEHASIGAFEGDSVSDQTFAITPDQRADGNLMEVKYTPEAWFWSRTAYHRIGVAKKQ